MVGVYRGRTVFNLAVPLARRASAYNAEMYALAHSSCCILHFLSTRPHISTIKIYSDCSSALGTIFDGRPHASQGASIFFRSQMLPLFKSCPNLRLHLIWTPGHKGTIGNVMADKRAKVGARKPNPILDFRSEERRVGKECVL